MHSTKILPPIKKQDGKAVHQMKKSSLTKPEGRKEDLLEMKLKNLKPQLPPSKVKIKSINNHETVFQKNISILDARTVLKISEKRKNEKNVNADGKRLKCESDPDVGSKSINSGISNIKKQNKSKILYPKTHANYVCKFCCRRFHSVDLLREHAASHGSKPSHVCYLCNHQAGTFSALMTHYLKHSGTKGSKVENIYAKSKADFCNIQFNISSRPKSAVRCTHCKSSFPSREKLDSHNCAIALQKKEYNCAYCGHISSSVDEYRNHVQSHSVTPFKCSYCNFKLQTKKQLDKHYDVCKKRPKPKPVTLQCDKCSLQCKSRKEFNLHIKTCGKTSDNVLQDLHCSQCNAKFEKSTLYENHILICKVDAKKEKSVTNLTTKSSKEIINVKSRKEKYFCSNCGDMFNSESDYKSHGKNCPLDAELLNEKTSVLCPNCGDIFHTSVINNHLKSCASQNEDFKSTEVNKEMDRETLAKNESEALTARRSARLVGRKCTFTEDSDSKPKKHLKIKLPKKPKVVVKKIKGSRNRRSKNPDNNFICNICNFTFCSKSTLLRHKRMHSGNPWFICKYCGKFFFRKDVYIRHEINVHNKSPKNVFCCYYCKVYFNSSLQLKDHVLETHKESAFLPMRMPSENDKNKAPILIKMEPILDGEEQAVKVSSGDISDCKKSTSSIESEFAKTIKASSSSAISSSFKCGICSVAFENVFEMETHLKCHNDDKNDLICQKNNTNKPLPEAVCEDSKNGGVTTSLHMRKFKSFNNRTQSESSFGSQSVSKSSCKIFIKNDNAISDESADVDTINAVECQSGNSDGIPAAEFSCEDIPVIKDIENEKGEFLCRLCLRPFSSKHLLKVHENTVHKLVDWYQCLVCDACGPKQEMQEHMFFHMYKVGTFVINTDGSNFDSLRPYLVDCNKSKEANKSESSQNLNIHSDVSEYDISDKNIESELPPLREFGLINVNTAHNENSVSDSSQNEIPVSETFAIFESCREECQENIDKTTSKSENSSNTENVMSKNGDSILSMMGSTSERNPVWKENGNTFDTSKNCLEDSNESCEVQNLSQKDNLMPNKESNDVNIISGSNPLEYESTNGDQNQSFSHLRYLLQNFNNSNAFDGKVEAGFFSKSPSPLQSPQKISTLKNCSENNVDIAIFSLKQLNQDIGSSSNTALSNSADVSKQSCSQFSNENNSHSLNVPESNQSFNTCLKFDITQSRGEFSENMPSQSKSQSSGECKSMNKVGNSFKPGHSHNTILDFSDLLQNSFGDTISAGDDNVFQYLCHSNQVSSELPNYCEKTSNVHNKVTNNVISYSDHLFPSVNLKCQTCNSAFQNNNDLTKHICSQESVSGPHIMLADENKSTHFPSLDKSENSNKNTFEEVKKTSLSETPTKKNIPVSVSCTICSSSFENMNEFERHYQADHTEYACNSVSSSTKCNKCQKIFSDVSEYVKHTLSCLKSVWCQNNSPGENLQSVGTLRSLLMGKEGKIQQETDNFNSSSSYENIINEFPYENVENLSQHTFDS